MANRETGRAYKSGFASEASAKIGTKRSNEQEEEATAWIAAMSGQQKPATEAYDNWLKNGVVLCNLANAIKPGSVKRVQKMGGAFVFMENISAFVDAVKKLGVPMEETFQTVDLWEKQNIPSVTNCIFSLSRALQRDPNYSGPTLGPKLSEENKREFTEEQLKEGQNVLGLQMGTNKGASQAGMNMGKQRMVLD